MKTFAEVRNLDNAIIRTLDVPDDFVAPPKFGALQATRLIVVVDAAVPVVDADVITLTRTVAVSAESVTRDWSQSRRPVADITDAIDDECMRRIGGLRAIFFMVRMVGKTPTAAQQLKLDRIATIVAFAENLKTQAGSITTVSGANWP